MTFVRFFWLFSGSKLGNWQNRQLCLFSDMLFFFFFFKLNFFHKDNLIFKFDQSLMSQMQMIMVILRHQDPEFSNFLADFEYLIINSLCIFKKKYILRSPNFAIPWILTWFAHNFSCLEIVYRIYDYLLCSKPETILYLVASVLF